MRVKLSADDPEGYRRVTYCMDGNLLRNVYTAPFTLIFDSRDFSNRSYELSIRALSAAGPIYEHKIDVTIKNAPGSFNFIFENPRRVVADAGLYPQ